MRKLIILLLIGGAGYYFYHSFVNSKATAARSVDTFHQQFNSGQFPAIYDGATPAFRKSASQAQFMAFMQAVQRKLGAFSSGAQHSWSSATTTAGRSAVLTYNSQFEQGSAVETFSFVVSGDQATLQGYNINSPTLVIK